MMIARFGWTLVGLDGTSGTSVAFRRTVRWLGARPCATDKHHRQADMPTKRMKRCIYTDRRFAFMRRTLLPLSATKWFKKNRGVRHDVSSNTVTTPLVDPETTRNGGDWEAPTGSDFGCGPERE